KPENIFLTRERLRPDHVKVVDFGISKFTRRDHVDRKTQAGVLLGTPGYMAPEQVLDMANVDARADVYALGSILYTALAGHAPFDGHPFPHILHVVVSEPPPHLGALRPDVPGELVALIARAMEKDRELRFASMSELAHALEPFVVEPPLTRERVSGAQDLGTSASVRPEVGPRPLPEAGGGTPPEHLPVERTSARAVTGRASVPVGEELVPRPSRDSVPTRARRLLPWLLPLLFASGALAWLFAHQAAAPRSIGPVKSAVASIVEPVPSSESAAVRAPQSPAPAMVDVYVTSDSPAARATLRGATHDLPYHGSLTPSVASEPVEVTAPGFQGRRFSVSFASSRRLLVHLPRGSGTLDATASETELALGAARAPASVAGARSPSSAPRAAGPKSLAGATEGEAEGAPLEPPSPPPAVSRPSPALSSPLAPPPRSKAVEAVQPPPVGAAVAAPNVPPGTVDRKAASAVIRTHSGELQTCLVRARMDNRDSGGRIALLATIAPNGTVSAVSITSSNANSARLEQCVLGAFRSWTLPAPSGGVSGSLPYAFNLQ
ncbi:MAG: AgmX/PglI C-terminal domain-containing protein, partial [Pseudomonadota bacterium]